MILNRYFFNSIVFSSFLLYCIFACLLFVGQILEQSEKVGEAFNFNALIWYSIQLLPSQLIELSAIIISVATLISLALMSHHSELSVLRCSGQSMLSLMHRAMLPALLLLAVILAVGELNIARIEQNAKAQKSLLVRNEAATDSNSNAELWFKHNDSYYYLSSIFSSGYVKNIKQWNTAESHSKVAQVNSISSMTFQNYNQDNQYWLQEFIRQTKFSDTAIIANSIELRTAHQMPNPTVLNSLSQDIDKLPFRQLIALYQQSHLHQLAFWNRLLLPLNIYSLILLSCVFVFSSGRQTDTSVKIAIGICLAIGGFLLQNLMPSISIVFQLSPLLTLLFPIALLLALSSYFIFKLR